jgi:hypothetical protein
LKLHSPVPPLQSEKSQVGFSGFSGGIVFQKDGWCQIYHEFIIQAGIIKFIIRPDVCHGAQFSSPVKCNSPKMMQVIKSIERKIIVISDSPVFVSRKIPGVQISKAEILIDNPIESGITEKVLKVNSRDVSFVYQWRCTIIAYGVIVCPDSDLQEMIEMGGRIAPGFLGKNIHGGHDENEDAKEGISGECHGHTNLPGILKQ